MNEVVTCQQCVHRRAQIAAYSKHDIRASELYRVCALAGVERSHAMYWTIYGKLTLCAAHELQLPTYAQKLEP